MSNKVVFLDLDGVCNDAAYARDACGSTTVVRWDPIVARATLDPARVALVQRVCVESDAAVVLVTGWARWAPVEEIIEVIRRAGLRAPVLGHVGGIRLSSDSRCEATRVWLAAHPEVSAWVVIDDTRELWMMRGALPAWLEGHLVSPRDGLTENDARIASVILDRATEMDRLPEALERLLRLTEPERVIARDSFGAPVTVRAMLDHLRHGTPEGVRYVSDLRDAVIDMLGMRARRGLSERRALIDQIRAEAARLQGEAERELPTERCADESARFQRASSLALQAKHYLILAEKLETS